MSDMPIGQCAICDDDLDHEDAGFCDICKRQFCWGYCGEWLDGKHACQECIAREEDDGD